MAGEVVKGLFGFSPDSVRLQERAERDARMRQQAIQIAQLGQNAPMAQAMIAGGMTGNALVDLGKAGAGMLGIDTRSSAERQAAQQQALIKSLQGKSGPEAMEAYGQGLLGMGSPMGVQALGSAETARNAAYLNQAKTEKARAEAAKAARPESLIRKIDASKYTPESVQLFQASGNFADLELAGGNGKLAELSARYAAGGKLSAQEQGLLWAAVKDAVGAENVRTYLLALRGTDPSSTEDTAAMKEAKAFALIEAIPPEQRNPEQVALHKMLQGKFPEYGKLTEEQAKTLRYASGGFAAMKALKAQFGPVYDLKANPPLSRKQISGALNRAAKILNSDQPILMTTLFDVLGLDQAAQEYMTAVGRAFYPRLRAETGAAISGTEWRTMFDNYMIYAEDSMEARKHKASLLERNVNDLFAEATLIPASGRYFSRLGKQYKDEYDRYLRRDKGIYEDAPANPKNTSKGRGEFTLEDLMAERKRRQGAR